MQKKVGNALYVFDTTPFTITADTDAEVIYVQQEYLKGYLELNTELESKIKTFNQWVLCVNAPWADEVTPGPEPTPDYHLLTVSSTTDLYVNEYDNELLPGSYNQDWFTEINHAQRYAGMIVADVYNKIYCNAGAQVILMREISDFETMTGLELIQTGWGEKYGFVMGDSDMTVDFSYTEKPRNHVNFTEDSNASADVEINPQDQIAGNNVYIRFLNGQSSNTIAVTSTDVELTYDQANDEYYFTMPEKDVNIKAVYGQKYNINFTEDSNASRDINVVPSNQMHAGNTVFLQFRNNQSSNSIAVTSTDVELTHYQAIDEYSFTMLDHDVNIKAVYTQPVYNVNLTEDSNANADVKIIPQQTVAGHKVNIEFLNGQSSNTIAVTSTDVELTYDQANDEYYFTMPEKDVNIKAVYGQKYNINFTEDSNASRDINVVPSNQMHAGNTVFLQFRNNQSSNSIAVTSTDVELTHYQAIDEYSFTMLDHDVNIKAVYTQPVYNVNLTEDSNANADVKIIPQQTVAGHKVNIEFLNGQSSSTVEVTSNDVRLKYNPRNDKYNFTMPENDVNIKAVYKQPIQISIDLGGTDLTCASYEPSGTYYPHAFFVVQAPEGKTTDNYTFVNSDAEHITVNPVGDHFDVEFKASGTVTFANA